jgi:hypothetical protein
MNFFQIVYKNVVCIAQETHCFPIVKVTWLMLFRAMITVYSESHTKHAVCG